MTRPRYQRAEEGPRRHALPAAGRLFGVAVRRAVPVRVACQGQGVLYRRPRIGAGAERVAEQARGGADRGTSFAKMSEEGAETSPAQSPSRGGCPTSDYQVPDA